MNPFKTFTLKWWQGSLFKIMLIALGLVIGATWPAIFSAWRSELLALFVILTTYITWVWWKQ